MQQEGSGFKPAISSPRGVSMFSLCLCGFSHDALVSSHRPETCSSGRLVTLKCPQVWMWVWMVVRLYECVSPVMNWRRVRGVPRLSPRVSWDGPQTLRRWAGTANGCMELHLRLQMAAVESWAQVVHVFESLKSTSLLSSPQWSQ